MSAEDSIDFAEMYQVSLRALLVTAEMEAEKVVDGVPTKVLERVSDQARRVGLAVCHMTFRVKREGWWVRSIAALAAGLAMDRSDCVKAVDKLERWGLLMSEPIDGGLWLRLLPSRLALQDRALGAGKAFALLEREHQNHEQLIDERGDGGFNTAMMAVDCDRAARAAALDAGDEDGGNCGVRGVRGGASRENREEDCGEIPHRQGGSAEGSSPHDVGRFPTAVRGDSPQPAVSLIRARVVSQNEVKTSLRSETRAVAQEAERGPLAREGAERRGLGEVRFGAGSKQMLFEALEAMDPDDMNRIDAKTGLTLNRFKWLALARDWQLQTEAALSEAKETIRKHGLKQTALGLVYTKLPDWLKLKIRVGEAFKKVKRVMRCLLLGGAL